MPPSHGPSAAMPSPGQRLLSAAEVAERCGMSLRSVRRFIAAGDLPVHRLGRAVRVAEADLERFLAKHRVAGKTPLDVGKKSTESRRKCRS